MAGGYPGTVIQSEGLGGQNLQEPGFRIINFVAMDIHQPVVFVGQLHQPANGFRAVVPGKLEVGDATNHISSESHGFLHELTPVFERPDALLGKRDDLQVYKGCGVFANLKHGLEGRQARIRYVHMGTDVLDAVSGKQFQCLGGAVDDVLMAQGCLALGPAFNAFKQGAAFVPARLPGCHGGVKMNVWLHERGCDEVARGIQFTASGGGLVGLGRDT